MTQRALRNHIRSAIASHVANPAFLFPTASHILAGHVQRAPDAAALDVKVEAACKLIDSLAGFELIDAIKEKQWSAEVRSAFWAVGPALWNTKQSRFVALPD
eukprot:2509823-Rhodomonas_salina.1